MMARQRLETMRQTNDGFVIAEKDLERAERLLKKFSAEPAGTSA